LTCLRGIACACDCQQGRAKAFTEKEKILVGRRGILYCILYASCLLREVPVVRVYLLRPLPQSCPCPCLGRFTIFCAFNIVLTPVARIVPYSAILSHILSERCAPCCCDSSSHTVTVTQRLVDRQADSFHRFDQACGVMRCIWESRQIISSVEGVEAQSLASFGAFGLGLKLSASVDF